MAETPSVSDAAQGCENARKNSFLNYESPALTAELQAQLAMKNGNALVARANAGKSCRAL